ncbi:DUF6879 family protein [Kitasatospora sp. LaBMicrA B282]|uniref:DUF6879 family protein n=1 Tax=Kitasatospora sp. LaBMicrA B282 TaxID=3420949 RepID=UPI003D0E6DDA
MREQGPAQGPDFGTLLRGARRTAVRLETRDRHRTAAEPEPALPLLRETVARGVLVRRVRIVAEPVTAQIRREHHRMPERITAGEQVRWLPRSRARAVALPGEDFWLIDSRLVLFHWCAAEDPWAGHRFTGDGTAVRRCTAAFEAAWALATPHAEYRV